MISTFLGLPILTRLYEPDNYSAWIVFFSVWVLFSAIATLRFELAVVLPEEKSEAASLWIACFIASITVGVVSWGVVYLCSESMLGHFHLDLKDYLPLLSIWVGSAGCYQASMGWFTRNKMFGCYALGQFALPVFTIGLQVGLACFVDNGLRELILGAVFAQVFVSLVAVGVVLVRDGAEILQPCSWRGIGRQVSEHRVYPSYMTAYSLIATVRDRFVYFLIGNYSTRATAGYFGLAQRFVNVPNSLAGSALRPVYFQRFASLGFKSVEREVYFLLFLITAAVIPVWMIFVLHADDLFALAFGEPWRSAGFYGVLLSIPAIPLLIGNWLDRGYDALGKQRVAFWLEMTFSVLSVGVLCVCVYGFGNLLYGIVAQVAVLTLYYWTWLWTLLKIGDYSMGLFAQLIGLYFGLSLICLVVGFLIRKWLPWGGAVVASLAVFYAPLSIMAFRKKELLLRALGKT